MTGPKPRSSERFYRVTRCRGCADVIQQDSDHVLSERRMHRCASCAAGIWAKVSQMPSWRRMDRVGELLR